MNYNGGTLRPAEIKSILEFRLVLDKLAVQLVIPRITDEELSLLKGYVEQMRTASTPSQAAELAFDFHHELGMISGNTLLPLIFYSFKYPILSLWERFCRMHGNGSLAMNTAALYTCIEHRDLTGAIESITASLNDTISGDRQIYQE
jgi:DNA-binding FadR family transcriptional regulator